MVKTIPAVNRLPKTVAYQVLGGKIITYLHEIMDIISIAYDLDRDSENYKVACKECCGNIRLRITSLKTMMRVFKKVRFTNHKGDVVPVVSPRYEGEFAEYLNRIMSQVEAWLGR